MKPMSSKSGNDTGYLMAIFCVAAIFGSLILPLIASGDGPIATITITGSIIDERGTVVEDVDVFAIDMYGGVLNFTTTNTTGEFSFDLERVELPIDIILIVQADGYFQRTVILPGTAGNLSLDPMRIYEMPDGNEVVSGTVIHPDDMPVEGAMVRIEYSGSEGNYDDDMITGSGGGFSFNVFPGDFTISVETEGIRVFEKDLLVVSEEGPYILEVKIPILPEKDISIRGFVTGADGPIPGSVVGLMDIGMEIGHYSRPNETGYYEMEFWSGDHSLISLAEGYEGFHDMIISDPGEEIWYNITLLEEEFWINGTVKDTSGDPIEGITVQFVMASSFLGFNSVETDGTGTFSIKVPEGEGYLIAMEESPFDVEDYEVFFSQLIKITDDSVNDIILNDINILTGEMEITMNVWTDLNAGSRMGLSLNGSRAARAMVDSMVGNGDMAVSEKEKDRFVSLMIGDGSELDEGPLGIDTMYNFTVNGNHFDRVEGSMEMIFSNVTGPITSDELFELSMEAIYNMNGTMNSAIDQVEVRINGTYEEAGRRTEMFLEPPKDWMFIGSSDTLHSITSSVGKVMMVPAMDPNPDDEIEHEFFTLDFVPSNLSVVIEGPQEIFEGQEFTILANITDHVPQNDYNFTWDLNGIAVNTTTGSLNHTFMEDGNYDITIELRDGFGRKTHGFLSVDVSNLAPALDVEIIDGFDGLYHEGEIITVVINASDVPDDPLHFHWGLQGEWSGNLTFDEFNSTFEVMIPDDGNVTVQVRMIDDDGGMTFEEIILPVNNTPPDVSIEILGHSGPGKVDQGDWMTIICNATDVPDDTIEYSWSWPDDEGVQALENGSVLEVRFLDVGIFVVSLVVSDEDGGERTLNWSIESIEDFEFDNDGDGIPRWWEKQHNTSDDDPADASSDPDLDELTNLQEFLNGTDPDKIDTDDDGMPDGYEIGILGLNPKEDDGSEDLDKDGKTNLEEFLDGTDPLTPESEKGERNRTGLYLILIAIVAMLIVGFLILMISRKREMSLDDEE